MLRIWLLIGVLCLGALTGPQAWSRSLQQIQERGSLHLCAHPNALPFSSKAGNPAGFQIELAGAIAKKMGVELAIDWVITSFQMRGADCDIVMDVIADHDAQGEAGLRYSKAYYRSGAALVVGPASAINSFQSLDSHTKVGVQVGSMAAMILNQRHVGTSTFGFEVDALEALAANEIDAATVSPAAAGYFNLTHPGAELRVAGFDDTAPNLNWNVAIGMRRPDRLLRTAINTALEALSADKTIEAIYGHYAIVIPPPMTGPSDPDN